MKTSDQINELSSALAKAQGELEAASFDSVNPHFKSKYASLTSIVEAIKKPLSRNGLSYAQATELNNGSLVLITRIMHSSGQWLESSYPINPVKNDPQGIGSALTYARRYSLSSLVGAVSDEDDDSNQASKPVPKPSLMPTYSTPKTNDPNKASDEQLGVIKTRLDALKYSNQKVVSVLTREFQKQFLRDLTKDEANKFYAILVNESQSQ